MRWTATLIVSIFLLLPGLSLADHLVVSRSATIKDAPNREGTILRRVARGDELPLVSTTQTNGYYEVQIPGSTQTGWIYRTLARRHPGDPGSEAPDWGLHIVIFDVGQADAMAIVSATGDACVVDAGHGSTAGRKIARFLRTQAENGVGDITRVKLGFATHYDQDHIGGFDTVVEEGITFLNFYDQGPSVKRDGRTIYTEYLGVVGDPNDNMTEDVGETSFIRKKAKVGVTWSLGDARIKCLSVRGDTRGSTHDIEDLDPAEDDIDENPGSIALLVTLGDFEFYAAGDQTSDDWKHEPDTEIKVVESGVIGDDNDIDVLKVNHHGSDTSTGREFVRALDPEVAIISAKYTRGHQLPKMIAIQELVRNRALVYVTGDGRDPETDTFTRSAATPDDDTFSVPGNTVINDAGDVHIFVSRDGRTYTVTAGGSSRQFTTVDGDHEHPE